MTTTEIQDFLSQMNTKAKQFKDLEDESITQVLKFFGIPETPTETSKVSIEELLKNDKIYILLHPSIYNKIDFTQFSPPKKLIITTSDLVEGQGLIYGETLTTTIMDIPNNADLDSISPKMTALLQGYQYQQT